MSFKAMATPAEIVRGLWKHHDKPERWAGLADIHHLLPARRVLRVFVEVWQNSESNDLHLPLIDNLIERYGIRAARVMPTLGVEDRRFFADLPERFRIYRGTTLESPYSDYSWSTDRDKALWFAQRCHNATPALATGWVSKSDILFASASRGESEIAVKPDHVSGKRVRALGPWQENAAYKFFADCHRGDPFEREMIIFRTQAAAQIGMTGQQVRSEFYRQVEAAEALGFKTAPAKRRALLDSIDWPKVFESDPMGILAA